MSKQEFNGVIRVYQGDPCDEVITDEIGFTIVGKKSKDAFLSICAEILEKIGTNPNVEQFKKEK